MLKNFIYRGKRVIKTDISGLFSERMPTLERQELELYSTVTIPGPLHKAQYLFIKLSWEMKYLVQCNVGKDACME